MFHSSDLSNRGSNHSSSGLSGGSSTGHAFNLRNHFNILSRYSYNNDKSSAIVKQQLPEFNSSISTDEDEESTYIYMDFPLDDRLFTVDNYKALESILHVYPTAIIRCQLLTSKDVYLHKLGNSIAYTHLTKYKKLGYNIKVIPYNVRFKARTTLMGIEYRQKWLATCCTKCDLRCRRSDRKSTDSDHDQYDDDDANDSDDDDDDDDDDTNNSDDDDAYDSDDDDDSDDHN